MDTEKSGVTYGLEESMRLLAAQCSADLLNQVEAESAQVSLQWMQDKVWEAFKEDILVPREEIWFLLESTLRQEPIWDIQAPYLTHSFYVKTYWMFEKLVETHDTPLRVMTSVETTYYAPDCDDEILETARRLKYPQNFSAQFIPDSLLGVSAVGRRRNKRIPIDKLHEAFRDSVTQNMGGLVIRTDAIDPLGEQHRLSKFNMHRSAYTGPFLDTLASEASTPALLNWIRLYENELGVPPDPAKIINHIRDSVYEPRYLLAEEAQYVQLTDHIDLVSTSTALPTQLLAR